jgi:hypothetical protein
VAEAPHREDPVVELELVKFRLVQLALLAKASRVETAVQAQTSVTEREVVEPEVVV